MTKDIATPTGFLMVLTQGDDVLSSIKSLAEREKLPSATFFGLGFAARAKFGFFNFNRHLYDPKEFFNVEITNLTGTIAWEGSEASIHAHATACHNSFNAAGGHLLELQVGTGSMEITILVHEKRLLRAIDPTIGGKVLQLTNH